VVVTATVISVWIVLIALESDGKKSTAIAVSEEVAVALCATAVPTPIIPVHVPGLVLDCA
jgi:hypothetical protein